MSKRFYAACAAMQGMLANTTVLNDNGSVLGIENLVEDAYMFADELLKQE